MVALARRHEQPTFQHCSRVASSAGLRLVRHSDERFTLYGPASNQWEVSIWPAAQTVALKPGKPSLRLPLTTWTLLDVINAAIKAEKGK